MASERLVIPEEKLSEVIKVILIGLNHASASDNISKETRQQLVKWCKEMKEYTR